MLENKIKSQIIKKKSFLCVGLDVDINKIPKSLLNYDDPIFEFAKLFEKPLGETSDIVTKENYVFQDRSNNTLSLIHI